MKSISVELREPQPGPSLDHGKIARFLHILALTIAVAAFSVFISRLGQVMGDQLTVVILVSVGAAFIGLPLALGALAWSRRKMMASVGMYACFAWCVCLGIGLVAVSCWKMVSGTDLPFIVSSFGAAGVSIVLAVTAAVVCDYGIWQRDIMD